MQSNCDPFWVNDPLLLFRVDRLVEFYPTIDMCSNERMNAISRFVLYAGLCIAFVQKNVKPVAISLAICATLALLYHSKSDKEMLEMYFHHKKMNCIQSTNQNPFMNLLPLDPDYEKKVNMKPCEADNLPDGRYYTSPKQTSSSTSSKDFAHNLFPKDMGACKGGNQEACGLKN